MFGMDPVLSGSLCFLVLAIAMYLKFIREQPWGDDEISDHKSSPVDGDDTMPFLHPASPAGRLQAQQQKRGSGQSRQQVKQKQQVPPQPPQPHQGYAGYKQRGQNASATVAAAGDAAAAAGANYLPKKQPMRRRTHSATAATPNNKVKSAVAAAEGDQLPTTIYEGANYDQFRQTQPQDSGRNQHRITFDDYDEEMGFLSPPRHADANDSLESVSFEAESDDFYDLENHMPEDHLLNIADTPERGAKPLRIGTQYRGGDLLESPDVEASPDAKTLKTNIERQFVRDVAPPAQMQLEVARKARIPLFLHSPMRRPKLSKAKNDSLHVDFKELQVEEMIGQDILEEFEAEVQIMSILRHPNICLLMGACLEPPTRCLVIEYLPRGSLWNVLRQDVVIDMGRQYGFARDTALGMNYLHSFQPPILHRDLKSPNLLIDSSYALKISDFGLARVRAHFQTMTGNCGTTQWMAPEVLAAEKYTEKADVFSYGVVVWETVTRQCPYEGLTQIQAALGVLNNNLRPTVPENCPPLFKKLMTLCWVSSPEERPSFEEVLEILNSSTVIASCIMAPSPDTTLGLLGTGKIGSAVFTGFCSTNGWQPKHAYVSARTKAKAEALAAKFPDRVTIAASNQEIVDKSDVVFIGLLPNVAREELPKLTFAGKKVVSMMATIPYEELLQLVKLPTESVVRSVPLPAASKRAGPILAYPDNAFARDLFAQIGTPVMVAEEAEITKLTGITALISFFYATCDTTQQWCVNNGVGDKASRDYIASFFHALATAGAESTEGFGEMADEAATPGGLNEQVHRALQGNGGYELVADQLDAIFKRLSGTEPAPRPARN
ncbi:Serine/threonine protein kinase [Phytophthora megakarya]|uniref:non-specific serine/threonine protein kinase n=1 Tax=Phytophthora megakarya TaxID=4795 RepID=A0A225X1I7_9STRA|nr:Serine/threonine protein kinase [Phytophthora megakarya]